MKFDNIQVIFLSFFFIHPFWFWYLNQIVTVFTWIFINILSRK